MKILVTGFDPFGGEKINPAWEAVKQLPTNINGNEIKLVQIPTVFEKSAIVMKEAVEQFKPDAILCIGQAGGRVDITPERVAINIDDARIPDNVGNQPIDTVIKTDGAPAYFTTLPIKAMVTAMKEQGVPSSVSNSAGTFVCNHIMYQALYYASQSTADIKAGFIHVPFIPEQVVNKPNQPSMAIETIIKGLTICLETIIAYENQEDLKVVGGKTH